MKSATTAAGGQPMPPSSVIYLTTHANEAEEISISCHENEIPPYVETELVRLYSNLFSSLPQFKLYGGLKNASTYVERSGGIIRNMFLFNRDRREVRVINEGINVEQSEVRRFCYYIFTTYPTVSVITFHAVQANAMTLALPYQRVNFLEDIVLTLPRSEEEYFNALGKSTRKTIKGYMNKFKRNFPSFRLTVFTKAQIEERHIQEIIDFKSTRMKRINKVSAFDQDATRRIIELAKECGIVCIATIDGRVCAGSISYRVGDNYFMHVSTHDPIYDEFRLGLIYCYLTICECMRRGGKECHFLWGRQEYKYRLLGVRRDLDNLLVYRSRLHLLLNADVATRALLKGLTRRATLWLHEVKSHDNTGARAMTKLHDLWRILRRQEKNSAADDM